MSLFINTVVIAFALQAPVVMAKPKTLSACLDTYPGYEGDIDLSDGSKVIIKFDKKNMEFNFRGNGGQENCVDCGVHIHSGTTCDDADQVGGHYWDENKVSDPWTTDNGSVYKSNPEGMSNATFTINSGYGIGDNVDHAVVVHAQDGTRIACGVLSRFRNAAKSCKPKKTVLQTCITKYPAYEGNLDIRGKVRVAYTHENLMFRYKLKGADIDCKECGIHIHSGTTCNNATLVGGHYWDDHNGSMSDPWNLEGGSTYSTNLGGFTKNSFRFNAGFDAQENIGHAVVVHDKEGTRYGCGVLSTDKATGCL